MRVLCQTWIVVVEIKRELVMNAGIVQESAVQGIERLFTHRLRVILLEDEYQGVCGCHEATYPGIHNEAL